MHHITACLKEAGVYTSVSQLKTLSLKFLNKKVTLSATLDPALVPADFLPPCDNATWDLPLMTTKEQVCSFFCGIARVIPAYRLDGSKYELPSNYKSPDGDWSDNKMINPVEQTKSILHDMAILVTELGELVPTLDSTVVAEIQIILNDISAAQCRIATICPFIGTSHNAKAEVIVRNNALEHLSIAFTRAAQTSLELLAEIRDNGLIDDETYSSSIGKISFGLFRVHVIHHGYSDGWFV